MLRRFQSERFGDLFAVDRRVNHHGQPFGSPVQVDVLRDQSGVDTGGDGVALHVALRHPHVVGHEDQDPVPGAGVLLAVDLAAQIAFGDRNQRVRFGVVAVSPFTTDQVEVDLLAVQRRRRRAAAVFAVDSPSCPQQVGELLLRQRFFAVHRAVRRTFRQRLHQRHSSGFGRSRKFDDIVLCHSP